MYKQKKNKQKTNTNNGITLIALVLTIIVLLILAGVALSLALGQNGLIFKARESKQKQEIALEKDRIMSAYSASFTNKDGKFNKVTFKKELEKQGIQLDGEIVGDENATPLNLKVKTNHNEYTVTYTIEDGRIINNQIGQNQSSESGIQVGDIITYDPTKGVTDTSKLTYISPKGTAQTGGNGYHRPTQTVTIDPTAKEWVVISTHNNQIKVISKESVGGITGGEEANQFTLEGGIGWLYAEEELHKACSIYGHGKGAKQITTTYQIGNKYIGEAQSRTLTGSGARSMTIEDIVKIMKGEEHTDFTDDDKKFFDDYHNYKEESQKSLEVVYPTISSDNEKGSSTSKQRYDREYYAIDKELGGEYDKDLVTDPKVKENKEKLKNHIFKSNWYWLSSRSVSTIRSSFAVFWIHIVDSREIYGDMIFTGRENYADVRDSTRFLRPVVYLDGSMIEKVSAGQWKIKD
ncbi:MAG: hypothetical protein ACTTGJ_00015 [Clostridium sp.]